jgi:hypothetical protein
MATFRGRLYQRSVRCFCLSDSDDSMRREVQRWGISVLATKMTIEQCHQCPVRVVSVAGIGSRDYSHCQRAACPD